ncbi:MAG TPA: tetratricopeptide repeat protein, partial [Vicinamibacterales bacterium]
MMHAGRRLGFVLAMAVIAGACASADRSLSSRFIRQGTPSMDIGGPRHVSMRPADRAALMRKEAATRTPPPPLASLEMTDPVIREALAGLQSASSSEQYVAVATSYVRRGVFDRAYDYLTRSLAINGPNAAVYEALARLWRDWGQPDAGLPHAHRAVFFEPQSPAAHNTLGTLLYRLGKRTDARASFVRAVTLDPAAWYAYANLCHVDMATGNTRAAIDECQKAKALRKS